MPLITALEPAAGHAGSSVLHVDGERVCLVPEDLRARLDLTVGLELTTTGLQSIIRECEAAEAKEAAFRYLSFRPRTRVELIRYLRGKGLGSHAEAAVDRCQELGYVDDEAYALAFARERIRLRPRGRSRLVSELLARGVERNTAERAARAAFKEESVTEEDLLRALAHRRARALRRVEPAAARRRLTGFLRRRGFAPAAVRTVVDEVLADTESDTAD